MDDAVLDRRGLREEAHDLVAVVIAEGSRYWRRPGNREAGFSPPRSSRGGIGGCGSPRGAAQPRRSGGARPLVPPRKEPPQGAGLSHMSKKIISEFFVPRR